MPKKVSVRIDHTSEWKEAQADACAMGGGCLRHGDLFMEAAMLERVVNAP